jgi:predicted  nucleic acid-binding Zn-ribbon protein
MSQYEHIQETCDSAKKALDMAKSALDIALTQLPAAEEYWVLKKKIEAAELSLHTFQNEAERSRVKIKDALNKEKADERARLDNELAQLKDQHKQDVAVLIGKIDDLRDKMDGKQLELTRLTQEVSEARAASAIERGKVELASKELAGIRSNIDSLRASMGALFQKTA